MSRRIDDELRPDRDRIYMELGHLDGTAVDDQAAYFPPLCDDVFYTDEIKNLRSRILRSGNQLGHTLDRIRRVVLIFVFLRPDAERVQQTLRPFLNDNDVVPHTPAPHASSDAELSLKERSLRTVLCQNLGRHQTGRTSSDNSDV